MKDTKTKEAADRILAHVYGHVDAFRARPPRKAEQFAAAGLMRCCGLLKGILVLDEARMPALASILVRQHWETWLVSLYVLLVGDKALKALADDVKYWKSKLPEPLRDDFERWMQQLILKPFRLEGDHQQKLQYWELHKRVIELLREREPVDSPAGVTGYGATYSWESLVASHANLPPIARHLVDVDDGSLAVSVDSWETLEADVTVTPMLYTVHLAHYVFKEFGLDGDEMNPFVADLVVLARAQEQEGN